MGKKGRKTRWRKLPIPIGKGGDGEEGSIEGGSSIGGEEPTSPHTNHTTESRITFNEDEYTKITTPRQDMLFKKGYLGKKRTTTPNPIPPQDTTDAQSAGSIESDQYIYEDPPIPPPYVYPAAGYVDHTGLYFINGGSYEVYDPYTGNVTVIVGPGQYGGPGQPVLTAVPCQPLPLQPLEWFPPQNPSWNPHNHIYQKKKRPSTDSQNGSGQSSESGPPGSQDSGDTVELNSPPPPAPTAHNPYSPAPHYLYPGYMFGPPIYNMNGVSVQGVVPQSAPPPCAADIPPPPTTTPNTKRRKKRRRRRREGVTDEGSESSCEEGIEAGGQSGASSDTAPGSSSSKTDSGIHTDPAHTNSGTNSPLPQEPPTVPPEVEDFAERMSQDILDKALRESSTTPKKVTLTEVVRQWLEAQGDSALSLSDSQLSQGDVEEGDDEEGEDVGEEAEELMEEDLKELTGQKNGEGNPFLALSLSEYNSAGTRVASDDWEDEGIDLSCTHSRVAQMCDPMASVDKYYRLGADSPASVVKTAVHMRRGPGAPFPCGVCCIIQ